MRVLLDTHTFLWFGEDNPRLSAAAESILIDPENERLLSIASLWELAIKVSQNRITFALPFAQWAAEGLTRTEIDVLGIRTEHLDVLASLPFHHRDPFDRMIIAQAMVDELPIISVDRVFDSYPVTRIW